ncbi:MAG: peptidoglycan DD-metalloendopeptidase family protein [Mariprofundaceae bacterium]
MPQDYASQIRHPSASSSRTSATRAPKMNIPKYLWPILGASLAIIVLLTMVNGQRVDASVPTNHEEWLASEIPESTEKTSLPLKVRLKSGDTAASALTRMGFPFAEVARMTQASKRIYALKNVQIGHTFKRVDDDLGMHIYYDVNAEKRLHLSTNNKLETWHADMQPRHMATRQLRASGIIEDSLFAAAGKAGMDDRTSMNLVDIFGWDIDFARDLRKGDHFTVLYEERFDDTGKMIGSVILAAEFVNQGRSHQTIRYALANGNHEYFTPSGHSMRKTYLKSPVKYSRISSRFSSSRKHPVLGYTRAHRGVDYAASSGTPIRAVGNGRVVYAGRKGGYGRYVKIRHNNANHATAYAHLRRYGRGIKKGKRVKQGQIIGYVGMSGLATGPHLHFEFQVRGRAVNPLAVRHKPAKPVPKSELATFKKQANIWVRRIEKPMILATWG